MLRYNLTYDVIIYLHTDQNYVSTKRLSAKQEKKMYGRYYFFYDTYATVILFRCRRLPLCFIKI